MNGKSDQLTAVKIHGFNNKLVKNSFPKITKKLKIISFPIIDKNSISLSRRPRSQSNINNSLSKNTYNDSNITTHRIKSASRSCKDKKIFYETNNKKVLNKKIEYLKKELSEINILLRKTDIQINNIQDQLSHLKEKKDEYQNKIKYLITNKDNLFNNICKNTYIQRLNIEKISNINKNIFLNHVIKLVQILCDPNDMNNSLITNIQNLINEFFVKNNNRSDFNYLLSEMALLVSIEKLNKYSEKDIYYLFLNLLKINYILAKEKENIVKNTKILIDKLMSINNNKKKYEQSKSKIKKELFNLETLLKKHNRNNWPYVEIICKKKNNQIKKIQKSKGVINRNFLNCSYFSNSNDNIFMEKNNDNSIPQNNILLRSNITKNNPNVSFISKNLDKLKNNSNISKNKKPNIKFLNIPMSHLSKKIKQTSELIPHSNKIINHRKKIPKNIPKLTLFFKKNNSKKQNS